MTASNFARAFALTLRHEGGYVDHPADPGGATNLGVTIGTLSDWLDRKASKAEVRALTKDSVKPIYKRNYWDKMRGDELPMGVDYAVYDFGVNSSPRRGVMALQRAIGVADDGVIGPVTLGRLAEKKPEDVIRKICADRMSFLRKIKTWRTFGKGWTRRVDGVLAEALKMAKEAPPAAPATLPEAIDAIDPKAAEPITITAPVSEPTTVILVPASADEQHDAASWWERFKGLFGQAA